MSIHDIPALATIDPAEVSDYLLGLGIHASTEIRGGALHIETDKDATNALSAFVPASTFDRATLRTDYVAPVPSTAAISAHLAHLKDFRNSVRAGTDGVITVAQTRHVVADIIDALRLLDARLNRDV